MCPGRNLRGLQTTPYVTLNNKPSNGAHMNASKNILTKETKNHQGISNNKVRKYTVCAIQNTLVVPYKYASTSKETLTLWCLWRWFPIMKSRKCKKLNKTQQKLLKTNVEIKTKHNVLQQNPSKIQRKSFAKSDLWCSVDCTPWAIKICNPSQGKFWNRMSRLGGKQNFSLIRARDNKYFAI